MRATSPSAFSLRSGETFLERVPGAELTYNFARDAYVVRGGAKGQAPKVLREIPRAEMRRWRRDPHGTINYAARRTLQDAGLEAVFRRSDGEWR